MGYAIFTRKGAAQRGLLRRTPTDCLGGIQGYLMDHRLFLKNSRTPARSLVLEPFRGCWNFPECSCRGQTGIRKVPMERSGMEQSWMLS